MLLLPWQSWIKFHVHILHNLLPRYPNSWNIPHAPVVFDLPLSTEDGCLRILIALVMQVCIFSAVSTNLFRGRSSLLIFRRCSRCYCSTVHGSVHYMYSTLKKFQQIFYMQETSISSTSFVQLLCSLMIGQ